MSLHPYVHRELPGQLCPRNQVELMLFVAIGIRIFLCKIIQVVVPEAERIALIGIVVKVFGPDIIGIQLEAVRKTLAHADRGASIKRFGRARRVRDGSEVGEWCRSSIRGTTTQVDVRSWDKVGAGAADIRIDEAGQ